VQNQVRRTLISVHHACSGAGRWLHFTAFSLTRQTAFS